MSKLIKSLLEFLGACVGQIFAPSMNASFYSDRNNVFSRDIVSSTRVSRA